MGVYHLMGLGRSSGAVTGPLSYLAYRYQRWNDKDEHFFARSGEREHRARGEKVGDVQALVFFTTREILTGECLAYEYTDNPPGRSTTGPQKESGPMKDVLRRLLKREWPGIAKGRSDGSLFWCEIDRRDIRNVYDRVVQVVAALAGVGGQGKEMWINLTGGNNVTNFALELAASLSGEVARLYYVQAENRAAERCVRFTAENGYWVELPVMPLALGRLTLAILEMLAQEPMNASTIHSRSYNQYYDLMHGLDSKEALITEYLKPMWKQGLIAETKRGYVVGPQWELIRPYQERLEEARQTPPTIEELAQKEPWIEREKIDLEAIS
jgi:hypothetical protein